MDILLQNCRIIDPVTDRDEDGIDLEISNGIITAIGKKLKSKHTSKDLQGALVAPGFFDMHVHLREPGQEYKETIATGTNAAAHGGFTGLCCMPNTDPPISDPFVVSYIREKAKGNIVDVEICGTMTKGRKGDELAPMQALADAGVKMISDDGNAVANAEVMRRVFEYGKMFDFLCTEHCEEATMTKGTGMHEGKVSTKLGIPGYPSVAEDIVIARDLLIAEYVGDVRYHVAHLSTRNAVRLVREAKARGVKVSAEVTPHHFTLTDEAVERHQANAKMNPPLREQQDIEAIISGLQDGTIDCISTDHAPHADHEKNTDIMSAAYGIIGSETAIGLGLTYLVHSGKISLRTYVEVSSTNPRRLMKLLPIKIAVGEKANLTIIDLDTEWTFRSEDICSKSKNTPFISAKFKGRPIGIVNNGQFLWTRKD
ncbi:MAG: dihydroorotase [Bacteroidota bacterium]|nr:dihydroorotase [Bacteroidota bacterium]MDP4237229.1 dihydroorotase [Bacteroidota bacterium]